MASTCRLLSIVLTSMLIGLTSGRRLCETTQGYEFFILDIAENHPVDTPLATVDISGNNSEIQLTQETNKYFRFEPHNRRVVLVHALSTDVGAEPIPLLYLKCKILSEANANPLTITVTVIVEDVNNNAPSFNSSHYSTVVKEDIKPGTTLYAEMVATDNDREFDGNSVVLYSVVDGLYSDYFTISLPTKPEVTLVRRLDYETVNELVIEIKAWNNPSKGPTLSSTATLTVHVQDADDLNPAFSYHTYLGNITEDAAKGTLVSVTPTIFARDMDTMDVPITYSLLEADAHKLFDINATTAAIWNRVALPADMPTVTVVVMAAQVDNPMREGVAILTINIMGANINAPRFSSPLYHVVKSEEEPVGATIVSTTATDIDFQRAHSGTVIKYAIVGDVTDFTVDTGGNVILLEPLDYEKEQEKIIKVTASDGSHTATTTVQIDVANSNDNSPVIDVPATVIQRERGQTAPLIHIAATDADVNDILTYVLETHRDLFEIADEGDIFITGGEDELLDTRYSLLVSVYDNGRLPRKDSVLITVIFPPLGSTFAPTTVVASASVLPEQDNMLTIALGAVAGFLLVIIIILIAYICWRNKRTKEELDKARAPPMYGAKGLTYRQADIPDDLPKMDLHYGGETDETSEFDGSTTVQENPLSGYNPSYIQSSGSEMDRDVSEIEVETAVIPYLEGDDYDGGYASSHNNGRTGQLSTFKHDDNTSSGSSQSDSTGGSRRGLVNHNGANTAPKMTSWDSDDKIHVQGAQKLLDPNASTPANPTKKEKPEITVYF